MSIRSKLVLLAAVFLIGMFSIIALAASSWQRLSRINHYIELGIDLQVKSRDVQSLMKDMVFDLFVPKIYGQLRSFTYSPRSVVTVRQWKSSVYTYQSAFNRFMSAQHVLGIRDATIIDQFVTAATMHEKAMQRLEALDLSITMIKDQLGLLEDERRFNEILGEDNFIPFFEEFRDTSYYFVNSFESFMNYFIKEFRNYGDKLRKEIFLIFLILAGVIALNGIVASLLISRDVLVKIRHVGEAFRQVSCGDFSARMNIQSKDEFGSLSRQFNELTDDLKTNVDTILKLTRNLGLSISESTSLDDLVRIIVKTVTSEGTADGAMIFLTDTARLPYQKKRLRFMAGDGALSESDLPEYARAAEHAFRQEELFHGSRFPNHDTLDSREIAKEKDRVDPGRIRGQGLGADSGQDDPASLFLSAPMKNGLSDFIAIPLFIAKQPIGVFLVVRMHPNNPFTDLGITRLNTFAEYTAITLDNHFKYLELIGKSEAEYQALQSQVQPHFIYNILNGFIGLNRLGARDELEKAVLALKQMLRYTQDSRKWTTLKEEFAFVEKYCQLQKLRFEDRLTVRIDMDANSGHLRIPRLILQPIVENAVIHGIEPSGLSGGMLELKSFFSLEGGEWLLNIVVRDNGTGFELDTLLEKEHIGIGNVRKRLKYAFPNALFSIWSRPGEGTEVRISLYENHPG